MTGNCDKVVLITGASSGIGAALAEHLASTGYKKLVLVARREKELKEVAEKCKAKGAENVLVLPKDLLKPEHCDEAIDEAINEFGRLDILIGNAGMGADKPHDGYNLVDYETVFGLNFRANLLLTQKSIPFLREKKGSILFTSSVAANLPTGKMPLYAASKAALNHYSKCMAKEEAKKGVRINTISPGAILDDMSLNLFKNVNLEPEAKKAFARKALANVQPLGRCGEVEDMAKLMAFLISDDNTFMTGSDILSDGGMTLTPPNNTFKEGK